MSKSLEERVHNRVLDRKYQYWVCARESSRTSAPTGSDAFFSVGGAGAAGTGLVAKEGVGGGESDCV